MARAWQTVMARARQTVMSRGWQTVMARLDRATVRSQAYHIREVKVPFRDPCFRPVADRNRVIVRWGGEQREANGQSVG